MLFNLFNLLPRRKPVMPEDTSSDGLHDDALSAENAELIMTEAERMVADPEYAAERMSRTPGDPHVLEFLTKLRTMLSTVIPLYASDGNADTLLEWLNSLNKHDVREERRFIERHRDLLGGESDALLIKLEERYRARAYPLLKALRPRMEHALAQREPFAADLWEECLAYSRAMRVADDVTERRILLEDVRERCGANPDATPAIRDGYVNLYGGLCLDLPSWLEDIERQLTALTQASQPYETSAVRIALLRPALKRTHSDKTLEPVIAAELMAELSDALRDGLPTSANPAAAQDESITLLESSLTIYTVDRFPFQYARIMTTLGDSYADRIAGEKRVNLERAIACFKAALIDFIAERFVERYAITESDLGTAYWKRVAGEKQANQEHAIACFKSALAIIVPERFPYLHADIQNNLGCVYMERIEGEEQANQEYAINCFEMALSFNTADRLPQQYARIQNNLGSLYRIRIAGEKWENQERAIASFEGALTIRTVDRFPEQYATTQHNLGVVYSERITGTKYENQERAIACYEATLTIRTPERYPIEARRTQWNRAFVAMEAGQWELANESCTAALATEDVLLALSGSIDARDALLAESGDRVTRYGYALVRLGRVAEAAIAIERGRARGLAEGQRQQVADPLQIHNEDRRAHYVAVRSALAKAQVAVNSPITDIDLAESGYDLASLDALEPVARQRVLESALRNIEIARSATYTQAKAEFDSTIVEIRAASDPEDFMLAPLDLAALQRAVIRGGPRHALVYLAATPQGGMALGVLAANRGSFTGEGPSPSIMALDLPLLSSDTTVDLLLRPLSSDDNRLIGSFGHAQEGNGFAMLRHFWPEDTLRQCGQALRETFVTVGISGTLNATVWATIAKLSAVGYAHLVDKSLEAMSAPDLMLISGVFNTLYLQIELRRSLAALTEIAMRPLAEWLRGWSVTSVTLIPCGVLAAFPLAAAEIAPGETFGDRFSTSVAPSARSLLRDEVKREQAHRRRAGVAALGDPRPTHQPLQWGQAEALTMARLARKYGLSAESRIGEKARRGWLLDQLARALLVDASCHGHFDGDDPLNSSLALAGASGTMEGERLFLRDLLNQGFANRDEQALLGLRLLILSACQTGIVDLRKARDEMRSLTASVLEAGADAAMGALWSVDDKATYLLITRFAQIWLPKMETMPPAEALAKAQHWLRNVTNRELRQWRYDSVPETTVEERAEAGSAEPERDPWRDEAMACVKGVRTATVRGAGERLDVEMDDLDDLDEVEFVNGETRVNREQRYDPREAVYKVQDQAAHAGDDDARPYADPYFWAGFQITGW